MPELLLQRVRNIHRKQLVRAFRFGGNSPSAEHLTRTFLFCMLFALHSIIVQIQEITRIVLGKSSALCYSIASKLNQKVNLHMTKKLLILTTGGTIASVKTPHGLIPALTSEELLSYLPEIGSDFLLKTKAVCNLDSTDITPEHWLLLAGSIREEYHNYDGFVICHGTDTMAYTAAALSYLIQHSSKPIVLTGAQKPIGSEITDAKANLRDSILYAADPHSRGVQIVFDGKVILGTRAKKTKTSSFAAFSSINYPYLATIQDGRIIRYLPPSTEKNPVVFYDRLNPKVFLLKLTPGISPALLCEIFRLYDCIILESFGVGGIPDSLENELFCQLSKYAPQEKVLVMTTQVTYEGSNVGTYEVGRRLNEAFSILEARDMTLEAVLTKMMWIMAEDGISWPEICHKFYKCINSDTLYQET